MQPPKVRLLTPHLTYLDGSGRSSTFPQRQTAVPEYLTMLALHAPKPVPRTQLAKLGTDRVIWKRNSALGLTGITASGGFSTGYQLDLDPLEIDVWQVLHEADQPASESSTDSLRYVLDLFDPRGHCKQLTAYPDVVRRLVAARSELRARLRRLERKRVLIVEDQIGAELQVFLGDYDCTVVESYDGFLDLYKSTGVADFNLALIDLRLDGRVDVNQGEAVLELIIGRRVSYPLIVMTSFNWSDRDITAFAAAKGVSVVTKGPAGTGQVGAVVQKVRDLLDHDLDAVAREQVVKQLLAVRNEAYQALAIRRRKERVEAMNTEWSRLWLVADTEDLGELRGAVQTFSEKWLNLL